MSSATEKAHRVVFFNRDHPGDSILVKQDPNYANLKNPMLAEDKYATFVMGYYETSDPEIIEALNSETLRAKGVRCMDNAADVAEFGTADQRKAWMQYEIERQVAARLEEEQAVRAHADASPFEISPAQAAESVSPEE